MRTRMLVAGGLAAVALGLADAAYRARDWGATAREIALRLPGDELVPEPAESVTRGVTVGAPPSQVWRWVVEVGRVRGGAELAPGRSLVLHGGLADGAPRDGVTTLHVLPLDVRPDPATGVRRCRLVVRHRSPLRPAAARWGAAVLEPVHLLLTRRLLLGVKERAERSMLRAAVAAG